MTSVYDKLKLLEALDRAPGARIREIGGGWDLVRFPKLAQTSTYLNFTRDATYDQLDILFDTLIDGANRGESGRKGVARFLCPALKGLSYHLHLRYGDRADPGNGGLALTDPNEFLSARAMRIIPERFTRLEEKVHLLAASISWFRFPSVFGQDRFIRHADILEGGVCFGLSTNWCLRFLFGGKASYSSSKKNTPALPENEQAANQVMENWDRGRMAKKAPFVYHIQNTLEEKARTLKLNEKTTISSNFFNPLSDEQLGKMDRLLRDAPKYLNASPQTNVQHFINRKFKELGDARIKKTYIRQGEGCALGLYSICSTDRILIKFVNTLLSNCQGAGKRAYVIAFSFDSNSDHESTTYGASIPYFIERHSGGHAIGIHCSEGGRWGLLDPSYGEVTNQTKDVMADILCDLFSYYSIKKNIWKVFLLEVTTG